MTTVYVNKRLGIAITDSRVTTTEPRFFFGFFGLTPKVTRSVAFQKAIYIHDRLLVSTGNVSTINRVIKFFQDGTKPIIMNKNESCECVLIGENYSIQVIIDNMKFKRRVIFHDNSWEHYMGSGRWILEQIMPHGSYFPYEGVFESFRKVTKYDTYTDDNINLYRI